MIKTLKNFFIKIYTSHFISRVRKCCSRFAYERELETEHNWNILTPKLWSATLWRCVFLVLLWTPIQSGLPRAPSAWCGFPYHISLSNCHSNSTVSFCSIRRPYITLKLPHGDMDTPARLRNFFRYLAIGMCHFRYLWNGLCDSHPAEIIVMQFRGHSLPVRQSMRV